MAVLGRSRSGAPPDQILDPPLYLIHKTACHEQIRLDAIYSGRYEKSLLS